MNNLVARKPSNSLEDNERLFDRFGTDQYEAEMVSNNFGLVVSEIKRSYVPEHLYDCAISEGRIALLKAARKFDPLKGAFSTYAVFYIRDAIQRFLAKNVSPVNISIHKIKEDRARDPKHDSAHTLVSAAQLPAESIDDNDTMSKVHKSHFANFMALDLERDIQKCLSELSRNIAFTIVSRYGLLGHKELTQAEIAEVLGCNRNNIRDYEREGLAKLRSMLSPI